MPWQLERGTVERIITGRRPWWHDRRLDRDGDRGAELLRAERLGQEHALLIWGELRHFFALVFQVAVPARARGLPRAELGSSAERVLCDGGGGAELPFYCLQAPEHRRRCGFFAESPDQIRDSLTDQL